MEPIGDFLVQIPWWAYVLIFIGLVIIRDIFFNRQHTIQHNFPFVGHFRYMLERIGPELRQYIVANNREELPFNRSQRSWIYASSKKENNYQGFGTDQDIHSAGHIFVNPAMIPYMPPEGHPNAEDKSFLPCARVLGLASGRKRPYRPRSVINISAMSYGSLSARAVESLNKGALKAGCYHNTGEGGLSPYHQHGADVVFHFGTGYFGVRDEAGRFSMEKLVALVETHPFIRAIEIKLSQGAKPGKGGVLPARKISREIAAIRGVPRGQDVISPARHTAFSSIEELIELVEAIAAETGLPVGIKSAVGKLEQWEKLARLMATDGRGPDFITIDGGEGGTGAAPPAFADHVALPFMYAFTDVYKIFARYQLTHRTAFIGSGKLGFPASALMAFSMGADLINVAREAMMSIGCIQAQICHTNRCPSGVATQNKWLQSGIDVALKSQRFYHYVKTFRKELLEITHACGYEHPCQMTMEDIDMGMGDNHFTKTLKETYKYEKIPVPFEGMEKLKNCNHLGKIFVN
ncbi:MAG: FMN-binding glutamate synthase family protein [Bacteroidetes bacterium]|nr:MAG: FMN-binding glutamate synthase family protein [Bacteroidota bacterium]